MTAYKDAGVDIDEGNRTVDLLKDVVAATRTPAVLSELGAFGGLYATDDLRPGAVLVASTDGVGTKVELAARHGAWRGVGADLVNHCIDDILVQGARPLFFLDYIATASLVPEHVAEIVTGMAEACGAAGCALLGGEMSGHIFLGEDYLGYDDGFFAAGRLLQLIASGDKSLGQLNADLPTLYSTPEYRPHCPDDDKQTIIAGVADALRSKGEVETVDGARIKFEKGWGILRASNTEPVLSLRFEGETEADALAYRDLFIDALKAYPQVEGF